MWHEHWLLGSVTPPVTLCSMLPVVLDQAGRLRCGTWHWIVSALCPLCALCLWEYQLIVPPLCWRHFFSPPGCFGSSHRPKTFCSCFFFCLMDRLWLAVIVHGMSRIQKICWSQNNTLPRKFHLGIVMSSFCYLLSEHYFLRNQCCVHLQRTHTYWFNLMSWQKWAIENKSMCLPCQPAACRRISTGIINYATVNTKGLQLCFNSAVANCRGDVHVVLWGLPLAELGWCE